MDMEIVSSRKEEFIDITSRIGDALRDSGIKEGACIVFCPHTTAGLTINEGADPDVKADALMALDRIVPDLDFAHAEGNSPAHIKSILTGQTLTIPVRDGELALGTWQSVFFCEFDGPRRRAVVVEIIPGQRLI